MIFLLDYIYVFSMYRFAHGNAYAYKTYEFIWIGLLKIFIHQNTR